MIPDLGPRIRRTTGLSRSPGGSRSHPCGNRKTDQRGHRFSFECKAREKPVYGFPVRFGSEHY
jgi:hypothetical protein